MPPSRIDEQTAGRQGGPRSAAGFDSVSGARPRPTCGLLISDADPWMLYRRTGDHAKAEEHLITATAMYRDMGMNLWLDKAEAEQKACA